MNLTDEEKALLAISHMTKTFPRLEIRRGFRVGRLDVSYTRRSRKNLWGRFGGGWNWKVGVSVGSTSLIVDLLVASVRFTITKKESADGATQEI